jgi:glycosyltransferase involved in cell wall biosynthesis
MKGTRYNCTEMSADKKLTIWCISKYNAPPHYGVGARLYYLAREFSRLGQEVVLISSDANHLAAYPRTGQRYNFEEVDGLLHLWIKTLKYERSASLKRFLSWFDFEQKLFRMDRSQLPPPDVVITSSVSLLTVIYGLYLRRLYGSKVIFEIRDIYPLTLTEEFGVSRWHPLVLFLGLVEKIGYRKADLIVGTMPNLKEHVQERIGRKKEVFYSPLGINEQWFNVEGEGKWEEVDEFFPPNKFVVGYAGSMGISNALDPFIEVIKDLAGEETLYFILVGGGDLKEQYRRELSGCSNVTIGPLLDQKAIPNFLRKCDLLYLAVHDSEVWRFGQSMNKLIDYMMAAKPVVASYSGYQSMLNEAGAGVFVPTGDKNAIIEAIKNYRNMDPQEREAVGRKGRQWVLDNHSYVKLGLQYLERIRDLGG